MKLSERDKRALQLLLIVLILIFTVVTMFYPEKVKYRFSLKEIEDKILMVDELEENVKTSELLIENKILELYSLEDAGARLERKAQSLKHGIKKDDLSIHMPSILISLEQNAKKNKVELVIEYDEIETYLGNENEIEKQIIEEDVGVLERSKEDNEKIGVEVKESNESEKDEEVTIKKKENKEEETNETGNETNEVHEIDKAIIKNLVPNIEGINITTVPIKVKGKYSNIREFIKYLDTIDYLEPSFIDLSSNGDEVTGAIVIHIFHGEVD